LEKPWRCANFGGNILPCRRQMLILLARPVSIGKQENQSFDTSRHDGITHSSAIMNFTYTDE